MKKRNENISRDKEIDSLINEMVDKPFGDIKKIEKKIISISIPTKIYNNIANEVHGRKMKGEKGISISSIITELSSKYNY